MSETDKAKTLTYGKDGDLKAEYVSMSLTGIQALLSYKGEEIRIGSHLTGDFNMQNILAACGVALAVSIPVKDIIAGVRSLTNVPGRMEKYEIDGVLAFVDYAHTDDALVKVLTTLRELCEGKLIAVFGAGGDRDKTKRPRMGKVSQEIADHTILTSDNPRTENADDIINEILSGMAPDHNVTIESDRKLAIEKAFAMAERGDVILVAGKGHEDYQIIGNNRHHFSDKEIIIGIKAATEAVRNKKKSVK